MPKYNWQVVKPLPGEGVARRKKTAKKFTALQSLEIRVKVLENMMEDVVTALYEFFHDSSDSNRERLRKLEYVTTLWGIKRKRRTRKKKA